MSNKITVEREAPGDTYVYVTLDDTTYGASETPTGLRPHGYKLDCWADRIPQTDDDADGMALLRFYVERLRAEADRIEAAMKGGE